jgi:anti-sigma B factor antagonist
MFTEVFVMNLDLKERISENGIVIELKGELDIFSSPTLKDKLYSLIDTSSNDVIIDMNDVTYIDSTGLGVFVGALKKSRQKGTNIVLKNLKPNVRKVFTITGLDKVFRIE